MHRETSLFLPVPLVWIPPRLTSSTLCRSPPRSKRVRSKSQRKFLSAQKARESVTPKLLSSRRWISSHSNTAWRSSATMTMVICSTNRFSPSNPNLSSQASEQVCLMLQPSPSRLDTSLHPLCPTSSKLPSRTSLLSELNLDTSSRKLTVLERLPQLLLAQNPPLLLLLSPSLSVRYLFIILYTYIYAFFV